MPEFLQRALLEVVLLGVAGGLLGTWVVLRRLAFFTHAAGSATFPGLVVAGPWGVPAQLMALVSGLLYAGSLERLVRRRGAGPRRDGGAGPHVAGHRLRPRLGARARRAHRPRRRAAAGDPRGGRR